MAAGARAEARHSSKPVVPSLEDRVRELDSILREEKRNILRKEKKGQISDDVSKPTAADKIQNRERRYTNFIRALKPNSSSGKTPFMVADLETVLVDDIHKTYAAGLLVVRPDQNLNENEIEIFFSEDFILDDFEKRSAMVLSNLIFRIEAIASKEKNLRTIFFHNFSRFDGILILKHLACNFPDYRLRTLMRNNRIFELRISRPGRSPKTLFRFRDSLNLLPGKLQTLAQNLCPHLGPKGSIPHEEVALSNLSSMRNELRKYLKQDVLLLAGIMLRAQEIYWALYRVDLESKITLSALALTIFRTNFYDEQNWRIHVPSRNEDTFIRRGYYGGHTDVYRPYGENLFYYDINALYPAMMKEFDMPGGVPVWHRNLGDTDLDSLFGFLEAYIVCPRSIKHPFLPYREKNTLLFPTGSFVGVYYTEELKYAQSLGYTVIPLSGYLFEKKSSPFEGFVTTLFQCRKEAKSQGNEAMSFVYKILMNSLYGRFGINPRSTATEICDEARYEKLFEKDGFINADLLASNRYVVSYHMNEDPSEWNPPRNSAIQLAAAITACARIFMYPYIAREDCFYTDTDSVVLGSPLPTELVSATELGKWKLEETILKGYFLAPKSYYLVTSDNSDILKFKGPAGNLITPEWFRSQLADPSRSEKVAVTANFRIDWATLNIVRRETLHRIGIAEGHKRKPIYEGDAWVGTEPIHIQDLNQRGELIRRALALSGSPSSGSSGSSGSNSSEEDLSDSYSDFSDF